MICAFSHRALLFIHYLNESAILNLFGVFESNVHVYWFVYAEKNALFERAVKEHSGAYRVTSTQYHLNLSVVGVLLADLIIEITRTDQLVQCRTQRVFKPTCLTHPPGFMLFSGAVHISL